MPVPLWCNTHWHLTYRHTHADKHKDGCTHRQGVLTRMSTTVGTKLAKKPGFP